MTLIVGAIAAVWLLGSLLLAYSCRFMLRINIWSILFWPITWVAVFAIAAYEKLTGKEVF